MHLLDCHVLQASNWPLRLAGSGCLSIVIGLAPPVVRAADPDPATAAAVARCRSDWTADDCRLTVAAMKVLAAEPRLAHVNLGLTVHDHVVTLWGVVPSREIRNLAEKRLLDVPGVARVLNQLQAPESPTVPAPTRPPTPVPTPAIDRPLSTEPPLLPPPGVQRMEPSALADLRPAQGALRPMRVAARPIITNMEPPMAVLPPAAQPVASPNQQAITTMLRGNIRYARLRAEVRGDVVELHGDILSWDDLRLLASTISHLPGVQRVLMSDVRMGR